MKGLREIVLSFTIGTAIIFGMQKMMEVAKEGSRINPEGDPILGEAPWPDKYPQGKVKSPPLNDHKDVVVAVIDTGCDTSHFALKPGIWNNPGESGLDENGMDKAQNGIDDDDNGLVDDIHGWNFSDNSANLFDDHGHGTHIAGIIRHGSSESPQVKMMILKYYDAHNDGPTNLRHTIEAIRYAVRMGAKIINYSGGGILKSADEQEAIRWAGRQGVLVVAAAGNEGLNSDFFHFYPADYDADNILAVGAVDDHGQLLPMSNFGLRTVDLSAPGRNVYSTLPGGNFGYMTGTSQATAWVSAAAALLMSLDAKLENPSQMIEYLVKNSAPQFALKNRTRSGSSLDLDLAVSGLKPDANWRISRVSKNRAPARANSPN